MTDITHSEGYLERKEATLAPLRLITSTVTNTVFAVFQTSTSRSKPTTATSRAPLLARNLRFLGPTTKTRLLTRVRKQRRRLRCLRTLGPISQVDAPSPPPHSWTRTSSPRAVGDVGSALLVEAMSVF